MFTQSMIDNMCIDELIQYSIADERCSHRLALRLQEQSSSTMDIDAGDEGSAIQMETSDGQEDSAEKILVEAIKELELFLREWQAVKPQPQIFTDLEAIYQKLQKIQGTIANVQGVE